ncbi:hypothetical protein NE237_014093 [Protea cynaroides]|uniref:K+ potassium transporter integral membrane domain-containing protein n=1 Tax=Protea cynaroides TaxID=273540 RepID=A0A9Q0H3A8_9MAGN|nr:hypothetical protein NE237_014093 [Protea cynaroides]
MLQRPNRPQDLQNREARRSIVLIFSSQPAKWEVTRDRDWFGTFLLGRQSILKRLACCGLTNGPSCEETLAPKKVGPRVSLLIKGELLIQYGNANSALKLYLVQTQNQTKHQKRFVRLDSLDQEAFNVSGLATKTTKAVSIAAVMKLAFQSIGVVYGDIGTSPLYVFASTFADRNPTSDHIIGALSLIIYSLTLFPLIKYVFIVLRANDNGDGGTFAMYSLICRHSKVSAIPNSQQGEDEMNLSAYQLQIPTKHLKRAEKIKAAWREALLLKLPF